MGGGGGGVHGGGRAVLPVPQRASQPTHPPPAPLPANPAPDHQPPPPPSLRSLLRDLLPDRVARCVPIPTAAGLTFYLGPSYAVTMCTGSAVKFLWERRNPASAETFLVPAAAGLIIGDGLWSVPSAVLAMAKVRPPICMSFAAAARDVVAAAPAPVPAVAG